jgi:hypothetical protein
LSYIPWNPPTLLGGHTLIATPYELARQRGIKGTLVQVDFTVAATMPVPAPVPVPVTQAPVTPAPVTQAPITQATITQAPVTQTPVTQTPVTQAPVTQTPVTQAPAPVPAHRPVPAPVPVPVPAPTPSPSVGTITSFNLVNAETGLDIGPLVNNQVLFLDALPTTGWTIIANIQGLIGSVLFGM